MEDRRKLVLQVAGSAAVLALAALAGWCWFGSGGTVQGVAPEEAPAARKERRDDRREQRAADLRQVLEARQRAPRDRPKPAATPGDGRPADGERSSARLTGAEKAALRGVMESFYSPERLREALAKRAAADVVREMSRTYGQAVAAESIGGAADPVPVGPAVREALQRMGLLKDYGMNVLHAQRNDGEDALQRQLIENINRSFAERMDALNADYPFLGARLLEP